ncbi:MAG: argininosuccinate lyase [Gammaproteobacteria bacterium (ex Lamellibrachia satsuma)]|nr:MAG: argininosuccinate lyase [Gammaproteobacteria bacterium (ex Lamellibrachia satsuma)]
MSDYYGEGGRLAATPQEILINSAYKHDCEDADILLPGLHKADLAHAIMLIEQGIIPQEPGAELIRGLQVLEAISVAEFPIDPAYGDVYNSKDVALKKEIGEVAGWLHIGRPRREAVNIGYLIAVREGLLKLGSALIRLATIMVAKAGQNAATIIPDFTYLHHAQATSYGHYLLTFLYPLLRDQQRLMQAFDNINQSPAGSGSVNGSRLPLNRERLRELLGFAGIATHTRDAMWQIDTPIETMSLLLSIMTNLSRLAEELQIWNTAEFSMVDLPDSLCRASVIMPQKKNPYPLAYIRGVASSLLGKLPSFAAYGKIASGNPDSRIFIYGELPRSLQKSIEAVDLMSAVIEGMEINGETTLQRVKAGFSYAADVAEFIVMEYRLDYRTAHNVVGAAVRSMIETSLPGSDLTAEILDKAAMAVTGKTLNMDDKSLSEMIKPESIVASRQTVGGAGNTQLKEMLAECGVQSEQFSGWIAHQEKSCSLAVLDAAAAALMESSE